MPERVEAFLLVGPTAAGKTVVAQHLAEQDDAEILSADAMLVYRGMDIGTAKPTRAERDRVRYWGIDLVNPGDPFSVARFRTVAQEAAESARRAGRKLIVVGGTGLYIKVLLHGLDELPHSLPEVRARWQAVLGHDGVAALQEALRQRAPGWLETLSDPANGRRLMRALELVEAGLTAPPASWKQGGGLPEIVGLTAERGLLEARIRERVVAMYDAGFLREVAGLLAQRAFAEWPTAAQAVGYAEAASCLAGSLSEAEARERTVIRTRQLAKRQMTWFRNQCRVRWVEWGQGDVATTAEQVRACWSATGPTPLAF